MNRRAQELLAKIEAKKNEIRTLADAQNVTGVKKAKKETIREAAIF